MNSGAKLFTNKRLWSWMRTSVISIGAFSIGVYFERQCRIDADVVPQKTLVISPHGDDIDSPMISKLQPPTTSGSNHVAEVSRFGFPSLDSLRSYKNFLLSYDRRNRIANWVLEYVTNDDLTADEYNRQGIEFREEKSFHHYFRSTNQDYKGSGYDRGHLAAAGNYRSNPEHIKETYILSNIAPQIGRGFNRDKWNDLEKYCRRKVRELKSGVWICTGPLYLPQKDTASGKHFVRYEVIGHNHVAVPTHFFKVLLYHGHNDRWFMECFLMPNQVINEKTSIHSYRVNPEVIERAAAILTI
ncbi:endonuclease G, mitochondrial-like protein [Euroglyphus maynei]|uniref:Endonuclease n=1 Tax=Euroglyphus maynei TaxID=6958 RepID=A0A1Y3BDS9_EURMA|nr:endonuclease G, mitochondrial-like protein [Euroglyphus maynei]